MISLFPPCSLSTLMLYTGRSDRRFSSSIFLSVFLMGKMTVFGNMH